MKIIGIEGNYGTGSQQEDGLPGIYLIASGGVGSRFDIEALQSQGIPAVILGKAIYEGHISLDEIARFITHNN